MLAGSLRRILDTVDDDDHRVLDVGGGVCAFCRAGWVIDILPYDPRRLIPFR